jgi:hypothetical protein
MEPSGMESADMMDAMSVIASSIEYDLGLVGMFSTIRWSCIGRVELSVRPSAAHSANTFIP